MLRNTQIAIPTLVRVKPGALDRIGIYMKRSAFTRVILLVSSELDAALIERADRSLAAEGITVLKKLSIRASTFEHAEEIFSSLAPDTHAIIGLGGGKALDVAKYVAFLARLPYIAIPTALSNDGLASPQSSLEFQGKRKSFPAGMPYGIVIDTEVCLKAPEILWHSGIGDLVAKITAIWDWKLAFHTQGIQIDDFAALLSDATVFQFIGNPTRDLEGTRLLGLALMLNGIAMEICGSSRPASGSEHLISHALDLTSKRPRLHGLQVGVATYVVSQFQKQGTARIAELFSQTNFWKTIQSDPFSKREWVEAIRLAPQIKTDFFTVLSVKDFAPEFLNLTETDPFLKTCFV